MHIPLNHAQRNVSCTLDEEPQVSYWLGSFPPAGCLSCKVSAVIYVKMGQNMPTIYECQLFYPNNGKGCTLRGGKKEKEKLYGLQ